MDVWVVEQRWEQDGRIDRRVRHVASSHADAEAWIQDHPDLGREEYWFAVWDQPIDGHQHQIHPDHFYDAGGESLDSQPIDHDADNRRAEQGGLSANIPGEEGYTPHAGD